jgi:hypothetical protein
MLAAVSFGSPWSALVGLAVAAPLVALLLGARRSARVAALLGLEPAPGRALAPAIVIALLAALVALAAAQPIAQAERTRFARTDAEAWFVVDTSRSMLAAASPTGPTRFARASKAAVRLRARLGEVPAGVASLTDRVLPNLFPTSSQSAFADTALRALAIYGSPPVGQSVGTSTSLAGLTALAQDNFFSPAARRRLVVVLTDGETAPFDFRATARAFPADRYRLLVIRFWSPAERVFRADGTAEPYVPDRVATVDTARLAKAAGGAVFDESRLDTAAVAGRRFLGQGPERRLGSERRPMSLAPWLLGAALAPLGLLLWRRPL